MTESQKTGSSIEREIIYPFPPERVWHALTDSEALSRWLLPSEDFEPSVGHRFRFHSAPGSDGDGGIDCEVLEADAPRRLSYSWRAEPDQPPTVVTWDLQPTEEGGTRLRLEHTAIKTITSGPSACASLSLDADWAIRLCLWLGEAGEGALRLPDAGQRTTRLLVTAGGQR